MTSISFTIATGAAALLKHSPRTVTDVSEHFAAETAADGKSNPFTETDNDRSTLLNRIKSIVPKCFIDFWS